VLPLPTLLGGGTPAVGACEERIMERFLRALSQNGKG
jgi:hypothetical protein